MWRTYMWYIDAANISITNLGHEKIFCNQSMIDTPMSYKIKKKPNGTRILLKEYNHVGKEKTNRNKDTVGTKQPCQ